MNTGISTTYVTVAPATLSNTWPSTNMTLVNVLNKYINIEPQISTTVNFGTSNTSGKQMVALLNSDGISHSGSLGSNKFDINKANLNHQQGQIFTTFITVPDSKPREQNPTIQIQVVSQSDLSGDKNVSVLHLNHNQHDNINIQLQFQQGSDDLNNLILINNNDSSLVLLQEGQDMIQNIKPVHIEQSCTNINGLWSYPVIVDQDMDPNKQDENNIIGNQKGSLMDEKLKNPNEQNTGSRYLLSNSSNAANSSVLMADYNISMNLDNIPFGHILKISPDSVKRKSMEPSNSLDYGCKKMGFVEEINSQEKSKTKKKDIQISPSTRKPRPGQIDIVYFDDMLLYCCPKCIMAFPDKNVFQNHLVIHKIERRFICDLCGAGLKRKEHLERHKSSHYSERPFVCYVCCKSFKIKEHLNMHSVIHSGVKTEVCQDCGKGFYRKDHLKKHINTHIKRRLKEEHAYLQMTKQSSLFNFPKMCNPKVIRNQSRSKLIINLAHQEMVIDYVASGQDVNPSNQSSSE